MKARHAISLCVVGCFLLPGCAAETPPTDPAVATDPTPAAVVRAAEQPAVVNAPEKTAVANTPVETDVANAPASPSVDSEAVAANPKPEVPDAAPKSTPVTVREPKQPAPPSSSAPASPSAVPPATPAPMPEGVETKNVASLVEFKGHSQGINYIEFKADSKSIFTSSGSSDRSVREWDVATRRELRRVEFGDPPMPPRVLPSGRTVVVIKKWIPSLFNIETGEEIRTFNLERSLAVLGVSPDGKRVHFGSATGVDVCDVSTGKRVAAFEGHRGPVRQAQFFPDGDRVASLGFDSRILVWNAESGKEETRPAFQPRGPMLMAISPGDGSRILIQDVDGIAIWHVPSGRKLIRLEPISKLLAQQLMFTPDGNTVLAAGQYGELALWEAASGKLLALGKVDPEWLGVLAVSPDGRLLAMGGKDVNARVLSCDPQTIASLKFAASEELALPMDARPSEEGYQLLSRQVVPLHEKGNFLEAALAYDRMIVMATALYGEKSPQVRNARSNAATCYERTDRLDDAARHYEKVIADNDSAEDGSPVTAALSRTSLAHVRLRQSRDDEAERIFKESVQIVDSNPSIRRDNLIGPLSGLAAVYEKQKRYAEAEAAHRRNVEIRREQYGESHPGFANALKILTLFLSRTGNSRALAVELKKRLESEEAVYGLLRPATGITAYDLAAAHMDLKEWDDAALALDRGVRVLRNYGSRVLPSQSEQEQLKYLSVSHIPNFHAALTFAAAHQDRPAIRELSAAWSANGKSIGVRALADRTRMARGSQDPAVREISARLDSTRNEMAALTLKTVASRKEHEERTARLQELREKEQRLSWELGLAGWSELREDPWVELKEIRNSLPADGVLIDIVLRTGMRIRPPGTGSVVSPLGSSHYEARIVFPDEKREVAFVDLGSAAEIDGVVARFHDAIDQSTLVMARDGEAAAAAVIQRASDDLSKKALEPLLPHLKDVRHWLISPDGALWLAPWSALKDADGKLVIQNRDVSLLVSPRDAVVPQARGEGKKKGIIVANPDYDMGAAPIAPEARPFSPLPGTAVEAQAVFPELKKLVGDDPEIQTGDAATELFVKQIERPEVLLLSTHGFNFGARKADQNPLLMCGLAFAGANQNRKGQNADDGILTGLEIVNMDLRQTRLVVLSACQTGIGKVEQGEGVAGIRQAFQVAGAQSVAATLWSIPDRETAQLMQKFFHNLAEGQSRVAALSNAQREMIRSLTENGRSPNPLFWGAFTLTGQWN